MALEDIVQRYDTGEISSLLPSLDCLGLSEADQLQVFYRLLHIAVVLSAEPDSTEWPESAAVRHAFDKILRRPVSELKAMSVDILKGEFDDPVEREQQLQALLRKTDEALRQVNGDSTKTDRLLDLRQVLGERLQQCREANRTAHPSAEA